MTDAAEAESARGAAPRAQEENASLLEAAPGLARIAATAWWHTAEWAVGATARAYGNVVRAAINSNSAGEFFEETGGEMRDYVRRVLGIVDSEGRIRDAVAGFARGEDEEGGDDTDELRLRGIQLLRRSADVNYRDDLHPAYERILEQLAPDEARILRLLALSGPQPALDVRAGIPMVSELVKGGLSMIGAEAGVRHLDRVYRYLNNLNRLGLIWFSREQLRDPHQYQVLEAQPDVIESLRKGGRTARTVRRSILLTPFGKDFCEVCLPLETAEIDALGPNGEAGETRRAGRDDEPSAVAEGLRESELARESGEQLFEESGRS